MKTKEEVLNHLESRCSVMEMCMWDVRRKLDAQELTAEEKEWIVKRLVEEKFIDEQRYAKAFVLDKFRFSGWGRMKITQTLRMKRIGSQQIAEALEEIDEDEYRECLRKLLQDKRRTVKGRTAWEVNGKLIRFAVGRGFETSVVMDELHVDESDMARGDDE